MAGSTSHPTRERLIDTMISLLDQKAPDHISVDEVLNVSGISKGSLYHHFEDFSDLLEMAYLRRFAAFVDESSESITEVIATSTTRDEMLNRMGEITRRTQSPDLASLRLERFGPSDSPEATSAFACASRLSNNVSPTRSPTWFASLKRKGGFVPTSRRTSLPSLFRPIRWGAFLTRSLRIPWTTSSGWRSLTTCSPLRSKPSRACPILRRRARSSARFRARA
jgi:AcrR family transcriptional regulator